MKNYIYCILVILLLSGLLFTAGYAKENDDLPSIYVSTFEELKTQMEKKESVKIILTCDIAGDDDLTTGTLRGSSSDKAEPEWEIILDLNGHTLTVSARVIIRDGCKLTLCDSGDDGVLQVLRIRVGVGFHVENEGEFRLKNMGEFYLKSGRIENVGDQYDRDGFVSGSIYSLISIEGGEIYCKYENGPNYDGSIAYPPVAVYSAGGTCKVSGGSITAIGPHIVAVYGRYTLFGTSGYDENGRKWVSTGSSTVSIEVSGGNIYAEGFEADGIRLMQGLGTYKMTGGTVTAVGERAIGIADSRPILCAGTIISDHIALFDINSAPKRDPFQNGDMHYLNADGEAVYIDKYSKQLSFPYSDVLWDAWYRAPIIAVSDLGIMTGYPDSSFKPNTEMSRAAMVTVLHRMAGEPEASSSGFRDVPSGSYYANAVSWAVENGIVNGYDSETFGPNDSITREQLAAMIIRYLDYTGEVTASDSGLNASSYFDYGQISSYAVEYVERTVKYGLITGRTDNKLDPQGTATRAELAVVIDRYYTQK